VWTGFPVPSASMIEFTEWATDILRRSHQAATRFNPDAKIRLARTSRGVQAVLTDEPEATDRDVPVDGFTIHVEQGLDGLVDVQEPHDQLVLRPAGSIPNVRGDH
jgi:hypothetical protein